MAGRPPVTFDADTSEFLEVARIAREFDPALHKAMGKRIRKAVKPAQKAVRDEVLKAPSTRRLRTAKQAKAAKEAGSRPRLRQGIARGIRVDYTDKPSQRFVGVRIRATSAGLAPSQKGMQRAYNKPVFRRRVFGTDTWVEQAGNPYFDGPIRARIPAIRAEVEQVIADAKSATGLR